jgi:cell division protease FtsH
MILKFYKALLLTSAVICVQAALQGGVQSTEAQQIPLMVSHGNPLNHVHVQFPGWGASVASIVSLGSYCADTMYKNPVLSTCGVAAIGAAGYVTKDYWVPTVRDVLEYTFNPAGYYRRIALESIKLAIHGFGKITSASNAGSALSEMQKSHARLYMPGENETRFTDVAGCDNQKLEVLDFIDYLKDPKEFEAVGAKIPKGILFAGPPGTGKTLLARAIAGEANCPFFSVNGSDFIEIFVGVGASRVRDLFEQAREVAPCIIFIDEIDSIARKRGAGFGGGDSELSQTLNQLLTEMDGFEQNGDPIIIIGATNRIDVLDAAVLRPGRFDRHVDFDLPYFKDRLKILQVHLDTVKYNQNNFDLARIARATHGFSGADLAKLVNEAAILAVRQKSKQVEMKHIDEAYDNIVLGRVSIQGMHITEKELWKTAIHEAGHALLMVYQDHADPLHKISIQPRAGGSLGVTHSLPIKEHYGHTKEQYLADIVVSLGGGVAEDLVFQRKGTGISSDYRSVRDVAERMVKVYGMSDEFPGQSFADVPWHELSDDVRNRMEVEIAKIIAQCMEQAKTILTQHRDQLDQLAQLLMEKEIVYGKEVYQMCGLPVPDIEYTLV